MLVSTGELAFIDQELLLAAWEEGMFRVFAFYLTAVLAGQLGEQLAATGRALQAERQSVRLLASERETVLDRVPAGVLSTGGDGNIASLNPFARRLLGNVDGKPLTEVFPELSADATCEIRRGRGRWVCSRASLPDGGTVLVIEDVTELERMREDRVRDERLVSVGRMAASMAHEIRNPLASLSSSLQLLREDHPGRLAELALEEAERLNRLVEDFLAVARRPTMSPRRVDVTEVARGVCDAFSRDRRYTGRVSASVLAGPEWAEIDPDRLRQALWNLLLNGAQAMPRGGTITITLGDGFSPDGRPGLEVTVADQGVGIPAAERDRVFDPFYTTRQGGTGLGLLLVEQVVSGHAGFVEVSGRPEGGTVFRMWFPREVAVGE
jgi:two-component system sensor histidine kinase PilS (NtrC family)